MLVPPLPPADMLGFMGEDAATSARNGDLLLGLAKGHYPRDGLVFDIGCGYGRLAYALARHGFSGRYVGVDVTRRWVDWLRSNFTPVLPSYTFLHLDVANHHYNRKGAVDPAEVRFPPEATGADLILLLSVFTHMEAEDCAAYLRAISRVMTRQSTIYATFFVLNDEQRHFDGLGRSAHPMVQAHGSHSRISRPADPLYAIGHDEAWLMQAIDAAGLRVDRVIFGRWCGRPCPESYQDSFFLKLK